MSSGLFPIVSVDGNLISNIEGKESRFFKLKNFDLEQHSSEERDALLLRQKSYLDSLDEGRFFKIIRIGNETYVNTTSDMQERLLGRV